MRRMLSIAVALAGVAVATPALAQERTVIVRDEVISYYPTAEVGVQAGVPTGLSAKYWLSPYSGMQFGLTWRFPDDGISLSADYVAHSYFLHAQGREPAGMRLPLYAGAGLKVLRLGGNDSDGDGRTTDDDSVVGARFPLGAQALFEALPVSVFAEIAPGAVFERKGPQFSADAGIGARVYF